MLIDTHCHLDAPIFRETPADLVRAARQQGVDYIVIPAVEAANFSVVQQLAQTDPSLVYALGIHPLYVAQATLHDLTLLEKQVEQALADARFVAIGEIGLDFFVPELTQEPLRSKQIHFYEAQLQLAQRYQLPVLLHVRRSQDLILKSLRRHQLTGIAHAFNGSYQQAQQFIDLGFVLGIGGAMTFTRAKQIRRLASDTALRHIVLETDAPDIPPAWLRPKENPEQYNRPQELRGIALALAQLRQEPFEQIAQQTTHTAMRVLPRLSQWHQQRYA